ncbi:GNAT family N-acetyltransferase [Nostocoides jenkinsii]|nr:GNAT family N-acetyltransferase [Tetrasphaera jenkinsii]
MPTPTVPRFSARLTALCERERLPDGTPVWVGPLLQTDRDMLAEEYLKLSPNSKRSRFLSAIPALTDDMLDRLVDDVDGVNHVALVVFVEQNKVISPIAIGRIVRYPEMTDTADIAFTVQDAWHGRGIATLLARLLCERAPEGITHLLTEVAADNPAPLKILGKLGEMQVHRAGYGVLDVEVALSGEHLRLTPPAEGQRLHPLLAAYARQILHTRDVICDELVKLSPLSWFVLPADDDSEDLVPEAAEGVERRGA